MNSLVQRKRTDFNFSYGSNMSEKQMKGRCPSAKKIDVAYLPGYNLVFNRKGSYREGGVASIVPSVNPSSRVYGVVWALDDKDLAVLDKIEDPKAYRREIIRVRTLKGAELESFTYVAIPQETHVIPDREYFDILLSAAKFHGFPKEYIETILKHQAF